MNAKRKTKLRIHPRNAPILKAYGPEHPAVRALVQQAEARDVCVGKEIEWPGAKDIAIDQKWFSAIDQRVWTFSGFAYEFISFDLVLSGWLDDCAGLDPSEEYFMRELPRLRSLLEECESAAMADRNTPVIPLISKAREYLSAYEESIIARVGPIDIASTDRIVVSLWGAGKQNRRIS